MRSAVAFIKPIKHSCVAPEGTLNGVAVAWCVRPCSSQAHAPSPCAALLDGSQAASSGFSLCLLDAGEKIGGQTASFVSIYIATAVLSELVSNNAAAALM